MKVNRFTKLFVPYHWWQYHHKDCGVNYRGCSPYCTKRIYEESNETTWNGPLNFVVYFKNIFRAILGK